MGSVDEKLLSTPWGPESSRAGYFLKVVFYREFFLKAGVHSEGGR